MGIKRVLKEACVLDTKDESYDLITRINKELFFQIDNDISVRLRETDENQSAMWQEMSNLSEEYPIFVKMLNTSGDITLSADEHKAFLRHLDLRNQMENVERLHIYFQGHRDCFAYLKRIGAIDSHI
jgi:hypothetical protein